VRIAGKAAEAPDAGIGLLTEGRAFEANEENQPRFWYVKSIDEA